MNSFFRKYLPFTKGAFESFLEYRARAVLWVLSEFLTITLLYFLWDALYNSSQLTEINGYTFPQMMAYVIVVRVVQYTIFINPHWYISDGIQNGSIAMSLIKPIRYETQLFFQGIGDILISFFFFVIPLVILAGVGTWGLGITIPLAWDQTIYFLISLVLALMINYFISFIFGTILFFTINSFGIWQLKEAIELIFSGSLIPLAFFPNWLYQIAMFLPFAQARYLPVLIIMGKTTDGPWQAIAIQAAWAVGLFIISQLFWKRAIHRITIQGG